MSVVGGYLFIRQPGNVLMIPTSHFSLENAPTDSFKGDIASMSGTVRWLSRVSPGPTLLTSPRMIQQGESLSTGKDGKVIVAIKNNFVISLAHNSNISFLQLLPTNFVIGQDSGSVTFQNNISIPLSIRSLNLVTVIDNATVQIVIDVTNVRVSVENGVAKEGYEDAQNTSTVVTVRAGQEFIFDNEKRTATIE